MGMLETDLLVIGGGINGTGVAADAAGRGISVILCEKGDLASATSSWSTKLIHGGLRYLEHYEFKLVHEALREREILLNKAPHLIHPLEFVLPHDKHLRSVWLIRAGLFLYDHLAKHPSLASSKKLNLEKAAEGAPLKNKFTVGFRYTDCQTDDSRLVIANAMAAKENGAHILTHTICRAAKREEGYWLAELYHQNSDRLIMVKAKAIVNATGPWVQETSERIFHLKNRYKITLVKGSHIVIPRLYRGQQAYILQNPDKRIVFAIPYLNHFTLIGTTDVPFHGDPGTAAITPDEIDYLCQTINRYFKRQINAEEIVWTYSGVRPLYGKETESLAEISRGYTLVIDDDNGSAAPLLTVYGGKITTFRLVAEQAMDQLKKYFPEMGKNWTSTQPLPGGDLNSRTFANFCQRIKINFPWLPEVLLLRLCKNYGSKIYEILNNKTRLESLGKHFGGTLYQKEVDYLIHHEWAQTAEDILWRRTKQGLFFSAIEIESLKNYIASLKQKS